MATNRTRTQVKNKPYQHKYRKDQAKLTRRLHRSAETILMVEFMIPKKLKRANRLKPS